jgi:polyribonucleotide nucleotidyltransferase
MKEVDQRTEATLEFLDEPVVGKIYNGKVKKIEAYGAFIAVSFANL